MTTEKDGDDSYPILTRMALMAECFFRCTAKRVHEHGHLYWEITPDVRDSLNMELLKQQKGIVFGEPDRVEGLTISTVISSQDALPTTLRLKMETSVWQCKFCEVSFEIPTDVRVKDCMICGMGTD